MATPHSFESHYTYGNFIAGDEELLVFRRFAHLNVRALLYLQSELMTIEAELQELDEEDLSLNTKEVKVAAKCWEVLKSRAGEFEREAHRMELIRRLQDLTYRYNRALSAYAEVQKLKPPTRRVWKVFTKWFQSRRPFIGHSSKLLESRSRNCFLALSAIDTDSLTRFIAYVTGYISAYTNIAQYPGEVVHYASGAVHRFAAAVGVIGATLFLEVAIVVLYIVDDDKKRLGLIALFTALFAFAISFWSNARRVEIFAGCAAYAAVLVVFVAGNLGSKRK